MPSLAGHTQSWIEGMLESHSVTAAKKIALFTFKIHIHYTMQQLGNCMAKLVFVWSSEMVVICCLVCNCKWS